MSGVTVRYWDLISAQYVPDKFVNFFRLRVGRNGVVFAFKDKEIGFLEPHFYKGDKCIGNDWRDYDGLD